MTISSWLTIILMAKAAAAPQETALLDHSSRSSVGMPISGRVISDDRLELGLMRVQLLDIGSRRIVADSMLNAGGGFQLPAQPLGFYEFRIVGPAGESRYSLEIQTGSTSYLEIKLPHRNQNGQQATISAARLQHKTSKKAQKEIEAATRDFKKGNRLSAIEHLLLAEAHDPESFDIISNLGALYLKERDPDKALPWLNKAWRIDPNDSPNNTNLSAYYAYKDDYAKAEEFAVASLRTNPNSTHARYMLAVSLLKQGKDTAGARIHLNQIQGDFAPARNLLLSMQPKE
jgi:tetratricopeptide (TPR) repeat protein